MNTLRQHQFVSRVRFFLIVVLLVMPVAAAEAIILFRTGDREANTNEPTGHWAGSGWQFEGRFGAFLGTAIAPHYFITAKHLGRVADTFVYHGANYTVTDEFADPKSDLLIFKVTGTFPSYAPLCHLNNEVGQHLIVIGRGTQRGPDRIVGGKLVGWNYGPSDSVQRWGENNVARIVANRLYALFDQAGLPEEAHLSAGDSGGAVFLNEGGTWKLAGINSDVDHFASGPGGGGPYDAAMFDERGSYLADGTFVTGVSPVPSGFYAARISSRLVWINSVIQDPASGLGGKSTLFSPASPLICWLNWASKLGRPTLISNSR